MIKHVTVFLSSILFFALIFVYRSGIFSEVVFWIALPLLVSYALGFRPKNIGFSLPPKKEIPLIIIVSLIAVGINYFASTMPEMKIYYSAYSFSLAAFAVWIFSVSATEFFFRGYMLFGLEKKTGKWSILIQAIPYTLIHIGKPFVEIYFSFFAGIIFAYINFRSRSFLPSLIVHSTGFAIIIFSQMY